MKRWILNGMIVIFALVFLASAYFLADYYLKSRRQKRTFNQLATIMHQSAAQSRLERSDTSDITADPSEPTGPVLAEATDPETGETVLMLPEFVDLYEMNNDIVGWIAIENTPINYPVMQKPEYTDYYLYLDFNKAYSRHGSIYVREACDVFSPSDNVTIYGHRMGDGTMFNALHNYVDEPFYQEHRFITFNTLTENHIYEIMAVFRISSSADNPFQYHLFVDAEDAAQFDEYVYNCSSRSLYNTGVTASYGDKLITLSTCEYTNVNGRLVVVAKRIY